MPTATLPENEAATNVAPYPAALTSNAATWHSRLTQNDTIPLFQPQVHFGRFSGNEVVVDDPGASRVHAVISWTPRSYVLRDLGSAGGTYLDGRAVDGQVPLTPGQSIRIGGTSFLFQVLRVGDAPAGTDVSPVPPSSLSSLSSLSSNGATQAAPSLQMAASAVSSAAQQLQRSRLEGWLRDQLPRFYWRVFLVGLLAYGVSAYVLENTVNLNTVPLVVLLASSVVPVSFVVFCWEQGAFADIPPLTLGLAFLSGGTVGCLIAAFIEPVVVSGQGVQAGVLIGLCEESAKLAAVCWFLRNHRLRTEMDGLVLGAAVGMGFAALETAGYGFSHFLDGFTAYAGRYGVSDAALQYGISYMIKVLNLRMELAVFGHGVWTAIVCAAVWRERGNASFRITPGVGLAFAIAVGLHAAWDSIESNSIVPQLLIGVLGLLVLRFFILEANEQARRGTTVPAPLSDALRDYFGTIFARAPRATATLERFFASAGAGLGNPAQPAAAAAHGHPVSPQQQPPVAHGIDWQPSPGPVTVAARRCPTCGHLSDLSAAWCSRCGGQIGTVVTPPEALPATAARRDLEETQGFYPAPRQVATLKAASTAP